jgi:hypothetical protein
MPVTSATLIHDVLATGWTPDDWGHFFSYFGDFLLKLLMGASPYVAYFIGRAHGQDDQREFEKGVSDAKRLGQSSAPRAGYSPENRPAVPLKPPSGGTGGSGLPPPRGPTP